MSNNLICPLLKEPCIREKCVCFSTTDDINDYVLARDYNILDTRYRDHDVCKFLKIDLDEDRDI